MKRQRKTNLNPGDILEMMVAAQSHPVDEELEESPEAEKRGVLTPIISIHGEDVDWHELEFERKKKDAA
jgi:hypothetical protein